MQINPQLKMIINKVIIITIAYILISWFFLLYTEAVLTSIDSLSPSQENDFKLNLFASTIAGLVGGVVGGTMLVLINQRVFRRKSYGFALMITAACYLVIFLFVSVVVSISAILVEYEGLITLNELFYTALYRLLSIWTVVYFIQWGIITLLTLFFLQLTDKFGPGILSKFLLGKYHQPKEESRIFMFLDMYSSTAIAEKIGHKKYFNLLNDAFHDITNSVLKYGGEIYQYVGDEVVISWPLNERVSANRCLHCFSNIQAKLKEQAPHYIRRYGVTPHFKAGLHNGVVTVGEIGSIKKDLVYSGDVLNTTSRIQECCNQFEVSCLISQQTWDLIKDDNSFESIPLGEMELRGKQSTIKINTIKGLGNDYHSLLHSELS